MTRSQFPLPCVRAEVVYLGGNRWGYEIPGFVRPFEATDRPMPGACWAEYDAVRRTARTVDEPGPQRFELGGRYVLEVRRGFGAIWCDTTEPVVELDAEEAATAGEEGSPGWGWRRLRLPEAEVARRLRERLEAAGAGDGERRAS